MQHAIRTGQHAACNMQHAIRTVLTQCAAMNELLPLLNPGKEDEEVVTLFLFLAPLFFSVYLWDE
jgi:hypothetical protein